jgi:hypothetical protein
MLPVAVVIAEAVEIVERIVEPLLEEDARFA